MRGQNGEMGDIIQKAIHYQQQQGTNQPTQTALRITAFRGQILTATRLQQGKACIREIILR